MVYRLFILLLLFSACQRKAVTGQGKVIELDIDTSLTLLAHDELPENSLNDIHHLLELGFNKANKKYDSLRFQMYFDPALKDSIRIQSSGKDTVYLTIGNNQNKKVALYSYLDILGYRFYGPEDHWTYIPELKSLLPLDTVLHSYFSLRRLAPSYDISHRNIKSLETSKFLFQRWSDRLRMANLRHIPAGHYGSTFNTKYKEQILAHPQWRGTDQKGKPRAWSSNLKLCYSHPGVIEFYKKDALQRLEKIKETTSPPYYINMEPPDGGGYCECPECKKPVSDQVYGLVNEVARYLYEHDTNAIATMYGYNKHAEAPSFPLHQNVLVGIVPYAFQGVGSPEKMMEEWESTGSQLYLRDYLAIPVWNFDRPSYYPIGNFLSKVKHIKKENYLGYTFETTSSFMAVGLQFYLLSEESWDSIDGAEEFHAFLERMFPGYEDEVSLIYENLPSLNRRTYADALQRIRDLKVSTQDSDDPFMVQRFSDLEFYIEYLYLLDQFQSSKSEKNIDLLLDKIMSEPGTRLLHPYGLYRVLQRDTKISRPIERTENRAVSNIEVKSPITLRRKATVSYQVMNPDFYLDSVTSFRPIPIRNTNGLLYVGDDHDGKVMFRARLKWLNSSASGVIIIRDENKNHVMDIKLTPDDEWRDYEVKLERGKFYNIQFRTPGSELFFQGFNRPFVFTGTLYTRYIYSPVSFFFRVPDDEHEVKIQIPLKSNKVVVKSGDQVLFNQSQYDPYVLDINDKEGQVIEVIMYRHGLKLLNIPQLLALHPEGIIFQSNHTQ